MSARTLFDGGWVSPSNARMTTSAETAPASAVAHADATLKPRTNETTPNIAAMPNAVTILNCVLTNEPLHLRQATTAAERHPKQVR